MPQIWLLRIQSHITCSGWPPFTYTTLDRCSPSMLTGPHHRLLSPQALPLLPMHVPLVLLLVGLLAYVALRFQTVKSEPPRTLLTQGSLSVRADTPPAVPSLQRGDRTFQEETSRSSILFTLPHKDVVSLNRTREWCD